MAKKDIPKKIKYGKKSIRTQMVSSGFFAIFTIRTRFYYRREYRGDYCIVYCIGIVLFSSHFSANK